MQVDSRDPEVPTSRWGDGDLLGAVNELSPERLLAALSLVHDGRVHDLTQPISLESPRLEGMSPYSICMWSNPEVSEREMRAEGATNSVGFADERVGMDLHTATHLDGLAHGWVGGVTYNRNTARDVVGNSGLIRLGTENVPPIITRGVLVDVVRSKGRELDAGEAVTASDIQQALHRARVELQPADAVLIRTGWGRYYATDNQLYCDSMPGIDVEAAEWLASQSPVLVGADTMVVEVDPSGTEGVSYPVHQTLLAKHGVHLLENVALEEIADQQLSTFLCIFAGPRFVGGTASLVRVAAIT